MNKEYLAEYENLYFTVEYTKKLECTSAVHLYAVCI